MKYYFFCTFLLVAGWVSCQRSVISTEQLVGKWAMGAIMQNGTDVSAQHNPNDNRWIELNPNGTFVSDGDPYGRNTGKWTFDGNTRELYLDSDVGEGDDSYWLLSETAGNGQMLLRGTRSEFTQQFSMVWKK